MNNKNDKNSMSNRKCKNCGKVFLGTVKDTKCERCKSLDAENTKKGLGLAASVLVVASLVVKAIFKKQ